MYGGSKLGRGGGRAGVVNKRNSFPPPPHRMGTPSSSSRLSQGSSAVRNRAAGGPSSSGSKAAAAAEETFSLVSGNNPLAFAMIIRLAPDMVEEIKRVESQGRSARIKFDSTGHTDRNVIDVGGKEFRFAWSREFGDLCDIYEERQSSENGNGLLVESGCAWRKLNVQRILDESTTKHVKMRSEEAALKSKERKAIVLDYGNPSMKSQIKQVAAVEVGGPPRSTIKSAGASTASLKAGRSASPLSSPPRQSGTLASPDGSGNMVKNHVNTDDVTPVQVKSKENPPNSEKEIPKRSNSTVWETPGGKGSSGAKPTDLRSMLIALLMENPKGMSLKALEKAVGDAIPNSARKIEPIIKKIAVLQTPGRYFLKPGVELDSSKKLSSESGSSPEDNHQRTPGAENIHGQTPAQGLSFVENNPPGEMEEQAQSHSKVGDKSVALENNDVQRYSPDLFGEKKISDNSEGQAASSSDSGSDSDSDSDSSDSGSDSGSHSRSRSRSKSPVGTGSGSSSDSESDSSSNSREASDEDVDIMSDDDKEYKQKLQASEPGLSASPVPWKNNDSGPMQNEIGEKQDDEVDIEDHGSEAVDIEGHGSEAVDIEGHGSDAVDIEGHGSDAVDIEGHGSDAVDIDKDFPDDGQEIDMAVTSLVPSKDSQNPMQGKKDLTDHDEFQERETFIGNLFDDKGTSTKDSFKHERSKSNPPKRTSINKSKRGPDFKHVDEISDHGKKSKVERTQPPISGGRDTQLLESPHHLSPNRSFEDPYKGPTTQMTSTDREGNADFGFQKGYNQEFPGKYNSDFQQSGRKSSDQRVRSKARDTAEKLNKHSRKITEKSFQGHDSSPVVREKAFRDNQNEDRFAKEKKGPRNLKEGGAEAKSSGPFDSSNGKRGEMVEKINETGQFSSSHIGNGRASVLQRELSDLELGELREPLPNEVPIRKQFDRKGSFKQLENKSSASDNYNSDLSKGKLVGKPTLDSGKTPPSNNIGVGMKRTPEHHVEESTRTHNRHVRSQSHNNSRDHTEAGTMFNKSMDASSKSRQTEAGTKLPGGLDSTGESHKKAPTNAFQLDGSKRGLASQSAKKNKSRKAANMMADLVDGRKDTILTESNDSGRKGRESSSDEDTSSYYKYEKDEPDLKGPIKDFSQYKEYVQEYRDKYDCYLSLDKTLESDRNKFRKLGKDLDFAKGKDMERYCKLLGQLKDSYRRCGTRHKRLKKIFVVLHEELKHLKQRIKDFAHTYMKDRSLITA
ncbi:Occludin ELL domain-containing protein [Citrus sinensis]|nr:Occludin ELL domain-containing protein [Citrus sinensis]